ncbi:MAG: glycosyltransferase, partial [Nanoarchaeota archaeon]|nr:glycosyltransferase [Nanoarchaeota archaeon]
MMKMTLIENKDITLILPTLNEEQNIKDVLDIVNNLYPGISIIVADDASADKTQDIVMDYRNGDVTLLDRSSEKEKGLTGSVLDAVRLVTTKYIIIMDADLQHPPEKIKQIAELLKHYDMVIGVREKVENSWP